MSDIENVITTTTTTTTTTNNNNNNNNTLTYATRALSDLIYVSANHNGGSYSGKNVRIENKSISDGNISVLASRSGGGTGNFIRYNTTSTGESIRHSCAANTSISRNAGFSLQNCNCSANVTVATAAEKSLVLNGALEPASAQGFTIYLQLDSEFINLGFLLEKTEKVTLSSQSILILGSALQSGVNHFQIPVQGVTSGTFLLRIYSDSFKINKKGINSTLISV